MATVTNQISSLIDARFEKFKTPFVEDNSASGEVAVKRAKYGRYFFKSKGNMNALNSLWESAKNALYINAISNAKTAI